MSFIKFFFLLPNQTTITHWLHLGVSLVSFNLEKFQSTFLLFLQLDFFFLIIQGSYFIECQLEFVWYFLIIRFYVCINTPNLFTSYISSD